MRELVSLVVHVPSKSMTRRSIFLLGGKKGWEEKNASSRFIARVYLSSTTSVETERGRGGKVSVVGPTLRRSKELCGWLGENKRLRP